MTACIVVRKSCSSLALPSRSSALPSRSSALPSRSSVLLSRSSTLFVSKFASLLRMLSSVELDASADWDGGLGGDPDGCGEQRLRA